jgi:hypothetical protein
MFSSVDTKDPSAVEREVQAAYQGMFTSASPFFVSTAFEWVKECFAGRYRDFQASDARYHDLEHTLQGTLCMVRVLQGRQMTGARPAISQRPFELGLLAILFHDTGYLKKAQDTAGTGAKYTLTHVARSVNFAEHFLAEKGIPIAEIRSVQNMIRCTGVHVDLSRIPFQSEVEKVIGFALGTGDLLGQMSADDYIDKLPILYGEFEESARFYEGKMVGTMTFSSAADLLRRTPEFWDKYVLAKLDGDFWGLYKFLNQPYPNGPNVYLQKIATNIARLRQDLAAGKIG